MRVVAGTHKGRRLKQPLSSRVRPTSARVREALFAMLADRLRNTTVLDLYAGTGALGLEALSRGAKEVVFVESQPSSLQVLRDNIKRCSYARQSRVIPQDVRAFLLEHEPPETFDLVFADPPYQETDLEQLLSLLNESHKIAPKGLIVLEHFKKVSVSEQSGDLHQIRQSRYGDTMLTFFQMQST